VSDAQFAVFCDVFGFADLKLDARLQSNNDRVRARDWLMPFVRQRLANRSASELAQLFEQHGLPFAPIKKPHELLDDAQLRAAGSLAPITVPDGPRKGQTIDTVLFPFTLEGQRLGVRSSPPTLGEHADMLLAQLGYSVEQIARLRALKVVG
jgi:crotonobetainyl-CoA:carnitine CoA-transferase CaiB-like acyl-CoA transferase